MKGFSQDLPLFLAKRVLVLLSGKYGQIVPGNYANGAKLSWDFFDREGYRAEIIALRIDRDDLVEFAAIPWPYMLIFVFGYSITIYLSKSLKKEIHDRGSHLFHIKANSFEIRFRGQRDYIIYCINYSSHFVQKSLEETAWDVRLSWEMLSPVFYNNRSKVVKRVTMDLLSMFILPDSPDLMTDFMKDELARVILMDFLQEYERAYQPPYLGAIQFESFYNDRDKLIKEVLNHKSISELLKISGIKNVPMFRKRLRQLYDLNVREFITEIRMSIAMALLKDPTLSIKEIADKTGFSNAFYFSRVFTNYFGQPPKYFHSKRSP